MGILNNQTILLIGESGCGKTTVANYLHDTYGYTVLESYTTRKPRYPNERGHIFITEEEYWNLPNKVAVTLFDNAYYCATKEQVEDADIYIIDPIGIEMLNQLYDGDNEFIKIHLYTSPQVRIERMKQRGDSDKQCWERIIHDINAFKTTSADIMFKADKASVHEIGNGIIDYVNRHNKQKQYFLGGVYELD